MAFAGSGQEALSLMEKEAFDVIVSDMRMPGMSGVQLLDEVRNRYPGTARIILSGQAERNQILQVAGNTHQYIAKPCDETSLKDAIQRSCAMRDLLHSPELRRIVSQAQSLPTLPNLYTSIVNAVQDGKMSLAEIGELIAQDMAISSKILQLINSAFFGAPRRIANVPEAVCALGIETVKALVLSEAVFSTAPKDKITSFSIESLWRHSANTASIARTLAHAERLTTRSTDESFTAAFLHDIGKLVLAQNLPNEYAQVLELADKENVMDWQAEAEVLGASHAEIGAYLLSLWGLPASMIQAIAWHHNPAVANEGGFGVTTAVYIANAFAHAGGEDRESQLAGEIDEQYLASLNLAGRLPAWRSAALNCASELKAA